MWGFIFEWFFVLRFLRASHRFKDSGPPLVFVGRPQVFGVPGTASVRREGAAGLLSGGAGLIFAGTGPGVWIPPDLSSPPQQTVFNPLGPGGTLGNAPSAAKDLEPRARSNKGGGATVCAHPFAPRAPLPANDGASHLHLKD